MNKKIRYPVVGLGHIAQTAVLPAFEHAENSELAALITGNPEKDRELSERYSVKAYTYDDLETALDREQVDAVYIATPNILHREHTERAARASVHVLCEKPMAIDGKETEKIFKPSDQFAPELIYFSDCIIHGRAPEPSGNEGLADVRVINAIYESAEIGSAVRIEPVQKKQRPDQAMEIKRPPVEQPDLVGTSFPLSG